jgi:putative chitinase
MDDLTVEQLVRIMPYARRKADRFIAGLNAAMREFEINTPKRRAAFLAQIGHESGQLRYVREIASGAAYEGRRDLGNVKPGDGVRFKGRGLIQITGRANYDACGKELGLDLLSHPELLEEPINACRSAGWYWSTHHLNWLADEGDHIKITKRINGGLNGIEDRLSLARAAEKVLA